jgi:phosphoribosyl 1,2-cyclic phosphate phosphodiesterase
VYGPIIDYYEEQGFVYRTAFQDSTVVGNTKITAIPVDRGSQVSFIYVFERNGRKMVYAPCDIKPFPEEKDEVREANLLVIQPGIFEDGLKHDFIYPEDHISRTTLYTFQETIDLGRRIDADQILFIHLEEYWNRSHDEYLILEEKYENVRFAHDGMRVSV